ncbi:hypothetical protein PFISCL1PPCAC_27124, partial [Pristionchus fissidentatus]
RFGEANSAAQFALNQAAQAQAEAQLRAKLLQDRKDAEARAHAAAILAEKDRQVALERAREEERRLQMEQEREEKRRMRAEMNAVAPIVRTVQRGIPNPGLLDPSRLSRAIPQSAQQRFLPQNQALTMAAAMQQAAAAAAATQQEEKEREERERFERERDRLERAAAEPMIPIPQLPHPSPMHIPSILQGRSNFFSGAKMAQSSPLRPGCSPGMMGANQTAVGQPSGMPTFADQLFAMNNSPLARFQQNMFGGPSTSTYGGLGQHVSPSPSTPQVMATPSPRPSILRRKGTDHSAAKRRLGFDESNAQTVGEYATAQLASGAIGMSDPKKIKLEADIKREIPDVPSTSSGNPFGTPSFPMPPPAVPSSAEPTPQKKRQRKQQFDANQAPEQIRMQISDPPLVPIMGMHSSDYPGGMYYYQLPPEAPKKKRGRPSSLAKEQALIEVQSTTRSVIVDVDQPKIVAEKKKGGRKKQAPGLTLPLVPQAHIKEEPLEEIPATPPRPHSNLRPKSVILQQHQAAAQQLQQQQEQLQTTPVHRPPTAERTSPVVDVPLNFDSDDDNIVSAEAMEAAKACAAELGFIGPDGEPRLTAAEKRRKEREKKAEEARNRARIERINSAGLRQLQMAIKKKEELERKKKEEEEKERKEQLESERSSLRKIDRRLRFLSHEESIIKKFFQRIRRDQHEEELRTEQEKEDEEETIEDEEEDDEEKEEEEEENVDEKEKEEEDEEDVALPKKQLRELKKKGESITVKEVETSEKTVEETEEEEKEE